MAEQNAWAERRYAEAARTATRSPVARQWTTPNNARASRLDFTHCIL